MDVPGLEDRAATLSAASQNPRTALKHKTPPKAKDLDVDTKLSHSADTHKA